MELDAAVSHASPSREVVPSERAHRLGIGAV